MGRWDSLGVFFLDIILCGFAAQFGSDDKTLQTDRQTHHHMLVRCALGQGPARALNIKVRKLNLYQQNLLLSGIENDSKP